MKKTILIPDLHGRQFWKKTVAEADDECRIIFMGDYTDPYGFEEITPAEAYENLKAVVEYAHEHPNVELLLGNHDCGYLFGSRVCDCRTDDFRYNKIRQIFLDNLERFRFCTEVEAGWRRYLVSHAGINRHWLEKHSALFGNDYNNLCEQINRSLLGESITIEQRTEILADIGRRRGGSSPAGSIVWADIDEFDEPTAHIPMDQIVGHTLQVFEEFEKGEYDLIYGGACIKRGPESSVYCIDSAEAYYIDERGTLRYMRNDETVEGE